VSDPKDKLKPLLIDRARAYISKMDAAIEGSGGDAQTFIVACKLVEFGLSFDEALRVISEYNQRCQPKWEDKALARKLRCAFRTARPNPEFLKGDTASSATNGFIPDNTPKWPKVNEALRNSALGSGVGLNELYDLSPRRFQDDGSHSMEVLQVLFPENPLICCGKSSQNFWTKPLLEYGKTAELMQLIVPSPMSAPVGKVKDPEPGRSDLSAHTLDNTGPRRFAVVEFDQGAIDDHCSLLWHLATYAPFVMAVHSGGKSMHGWFYVQGSSEDLVRRFYRYAVSIGADRATFTKSQFVRMPDGLRSNGNRQHIYYFNPSLPCLKT